MIFYISYKTPWLFLKWKDSPYQWFVRLKLGQNQGLKSHKLSFLIALGYDFFNVKQLLIGNILHDIEFTLKSTDSVLVKTKISLFLHKGLIKLIFIELMKSITLLQKYVFAIILLYATLASSQVGIGTTTPSGGALLDLTSADKGFLVPRVNITNLSTIAPVTGGSTVGLLVWNTNTGTGVGYHYWSGSAWTPLTGSSSGNHWDLAGNAITSSDFLGTTNGFDLNIRTNNTNRMRVQSNGQVTVGFGATTANTGDQFSSVGTYGVAGYSGSTGSGVYGQNISSGNGVYGLNSSSGNGVYGYNNSTGDAIRAEHDGSGNGVNSVNYGNGTGLYAENYYFTNYAIHAVDGIASVYADNSAFGYDGVVALTDDSISNAVWGTNDNTSGTAVLGGKNGVSVYTGVGSGVAGSGDNLGIYGYAGLGARNNGNLGNSAGAFTLDTDSNPSTNGTNNGTRASASIAGFDNVSPNGSLSAADSYFGGYFAGGNHNNGTPSYAYAGIKYNTNNNGTTGTNYKIIGNGTNSTIVKDANNTPRILFSPEAPEILFEDYGVGNLVNGKAEIILDPILTHAIYVDKNHPLKVFIQLEGDCNGVYVTNKSATGFTVVELQNGQSNVPFSWHIVANRADDIENGEITSKHVGLRFPVGPGPLKEVKATSRRKDDNLNKTVDVSSRKKRINPVNKENIEEQQTEKSAEELEKITKKVTL